MSVLQDYLSDKNSLIDMFAMIDPQNHKSVDVPRRVGFDHIVIGTRIINVDWNLLDKTIKIESQKNHTKTLYYQECRSEKFRLTICANADKEHWYSSISIRLRSNKLSIKKCNLPNCSDICNFEINIPPISEHEILGNISNMTVPLEQAYGTPFSTFSRCS